MAERMDEVRQRAEWLVGMNDRIAIELVKTMTGGGGIARCIALSHVMSERMKTMSDLVFQSMNDLELQEAHQSGEWDAALMSRQQIPDDLRKSALLLLGAANIIIEGIDAARKASETQEQEHEDQELPDSEALSRFERGTSAPSTKAPDSAECTPGTNSGVDPAGQECQHGQQAGGDGECSERTDWDSPSIGLGELARHLELSGLQSGQLPGGVE